MSDEPISDERLVEVRARLTPGRTLPSRATILSILARLDKAEAGWKDISTAPFELDDFGYRWLTWCLLWVPDEDGGLPVVGGMDADMWLWRVDDRSCGDFETPPTHWMPLPPPPSKEP